MGAQPARETTTPRPQKSAGACNSLRRRVLTVGHSSGAERRFWRRSSRRSSRRFARPFARRFARRSSRRFARRFSRRSSGRGNAQHAHNIADVSPRAHFSARARARARTFRNRATGPAGILFRPPGTRRNSGTAAELRRATRARKGIPAGALARFRKKKNLF